MSRVVASGRIRPIDPFLAASQTLSASHGYLLLEIAGVFRPEHRIAVHAAVGINVMVGLGDAREAARRSMDAVIAMKSA
jgi:hypothetical protein